MSNSPLVTHTALSPNHSGKRNHAIDTITIHCFVGQVTAKRGCEVFLPKGNASCNYVVGYDGSIGLCVEEKDRSWCTSSRSNDNRAVTIETASDNKDPYAVTDAAYSALLDLVTDICRRNGARKLLWFGDKGKTLSYIPRDGEMVMTVHRWFANKSCPGPYLYARHGQIAAEVTRRLGKDDDEMDQATFNKMMQEYEKSKARPVPDSTPADWEKDGVEWAMENGIMAGNGNGDLMLHSPLTRGQFCVMLKRYHEELGK